MEGFGPCKEGVIRAESSQREGESDERTRTLLGTFRQALEQEEEKEEDEAILRGHQEVSQCQIP